MQPSAPSCRPPRTSQQYQGGQALIYGIFVMMASLTALFFLFNTGQLSSEKTKLVNTADAVAYSAAVMHARALNFDAYNNRALVANEVLVAQMVSLSSWAQYAQTHAENIAWVFPECLLQDPETLAAGIAYGTLYNYGPMYALMCNLTAKVTGRPIEQIAARVPTLTKAVVTAVEVNKAAIQAAQAYLHADLRRARTEVMQQVADLNYAGDGSVSVEAIPSAAEAGANPTSDPWQDFTHRYAKDERTRFAEVARIAAYSDDFVKQRNWTAEALLTLEWKCILHNRKNSVKRRGGTELIGLDEWKAEDTESFWRASNASGLNTRCDENETPIGWGEQRAFPAGSEQDASAAILGGSPSTNPRGHGNASSAAWTNYTGLPSFYDLSPQWLAKRDPRLTFAVRLVRAAAATRTSDGTSTIKPSARLNHFSGKLAGGVMAAIATGEVYFERPWFNTGDDTYGNGNSTYVITKNQYAVDKNLGDQQETGSLFNPYWQVRLVPNRQSDVDAQRQQQGLGAP